MGVSLAQITHFGSSGKDCSLHRWFHGQLGGGFIGLEYGKILFSFLIDYAVLLFQRSTRVCQLVRKCFGLLHFRLLCTIMLIHRLCYVLDFSGRI